MASGYPTGGPHNRQWEHPNELNYKLNYKKPLPTKTLADFFNDQFFLGFQDQLSRWQQLPSRAATFPPYNLIQVDENNYRIELAVAGYKKEELTITVEKDTLTIKTVDSQNQDEPLAVLHKGIASRSFTQQFVLGEWMGVKGATIADGILTVEIEKQVPEELKPITISIQ